MEFNSKPPNLDFYRDMASIICAFEIPSHDTQNKTLLGTPWNKYPDTTKYIQKEKYPFTKGVQSINVL